MSTVAPAVSAGTNVNKSFPLPWRTPFTFNSSRQRNQGWVVRNESLAFTLLTASLRVNGVLKTAVEWRDFQAVFQQEIKRKKRKLETRAPRAMEEHNVRTLGVANGSSPATSLCSLWMQPEHKHVGDGATSLLLPLRISRVRNYGGQVLFEVETSSDFGPF